MVHIDEDSVGTTPVDLKSVITGTHRVRISMAGYNDYVDDVTVSPGQMFDLKVTLTKSTPGAASQYTYPPQAPTAASTYTTSDISLKKALADLTLSQAASGQLPGTGILIVSSNPAGANVYVDGKSEGKTPLTLPNMTAGQHNLLLTLTDYTDASRAVNVSSGAENQVAVDMIAVKKTPGFAAMAGVLSLALLVLFRRRPG
jgi:PEGA domain